jgi:Ankyrin repeats (many copies)
MSSRPIPLRPSIEFDRQQAKALLDALQRGDAEAAQRFRTHHPRFGPQGAPRGAALHDAQLVIAREYGFASWPRWKQFVEARQLDARERAAAHDVDAMRRFLEAGADPNTPGGIDETPPLHWACWRGQLEAARLLIERGADIHAHNRYGSDALGTTVHGSMNCHDVRGGITMKLAKEITHGDYPAVAEVLIAAGARLPERVRGSEAVQDALRRAGVPDPD